MAVLPTCSGAERKRCSKSSPCRPCAERRWSEGAAHIGVIRAVEQAGIPIDYIAGPETEAIVGGLYAMGYTTDESEQLVKMQDWETSCRQIAPQAALARTARTQGTLHPEYPPFTKCQTRKWMVLCADAIWAICWPGSLWAITTASVSTACTYPLPAWLPIWPMATKWCCAVANSSRHTRQYGHSRKFLLP